MVAGILCMQSHQLAKRDQERLADALQHQALRACSDPALTVPRTAVIWMSAADEAIAEQRKVTCHVNLCVLPHSYLTACHSACPHKSEHACGALGCCHRAMQ